MFFRKYGLPALKIHLAWIALLHSAAFCIFWMTNRGYHPQVNDFLTSLLGKAGDYVSIFTGIGWGVLVCSLAIIGLSQWKAAYTGGFGVIFSGLTAVLDGLFIVFFYGSFIALLRQDPTQLDRLKQILQTYRWLVDAFVMLGAAWLLSRGIVPILTGRLHLTPAAAGWTAAGVLGVLWLLPLANLPTGVVRGALPPKPLLIAHRGAAWLAPENTLAAMERAASLGAYGLESDVHVSTDGVLFLMHDQNLKRTTDIEAVYPARKEEHAANFAWDELTRLNAGEWFTRLDPYRTIQAGLSDSVQIKSYAQQVIPTLGELVQIAVRNGTIVLYDLYDPPEGHPCHGQSLALSLKALQAAQLGKQAWVLAGEQEIEQVKAALPEAILVAGIDARNPPQADRLSDLGYSVVNSEYPLSTAAMRSYQQAGLWVNLWTVDEPWLLGRSWLLGVNSVTTNNLHGLSAMTRPFLAVPLAGYIGLWAAVGLLAAWILATGRL